MSKPPLTIWLQFLDDDLGATWTETKVCIEDVEYVQADEMREAWFLLSVLSANIMDDGPSWPRALEWLKRNEKHKPN